MIEYVPVSPENNTAASHACLKTATTTVKDLTYGCNRRHLVSGAIRDFAPSQLPSVIASICVAASV